MLDAHFDEPNVFRVGADFDGVISDMARLIRVGMRELYHREIPFGRERKDLMIGDGIVTDEEYRNLIDTISVTDKYLDQMIPVAGMLTHISQLRTVASDVEIRIITARYEKGTAIAQKWIDQCCLGLTVESSSGEESKALKARGLHVFLDDTLERLEELDGSVPHRFLFSWPYNESDRVKDPSIIRVSSWREFTTHVRDIARAHPPG